MSEHSEPQQPRFDAEMTCPTCEGSGRVPVHRVPTPISRERLEMLLIDARNGAAMGIGGLSVEQAEALLGGDTVTVSGIELPGEGVSGDMRAVWHATEVALGVLLPGYVPKREALHDVERMLAWLAGNDDSWPTTD